MGSRVERRAKRAREGSAWSEWGPTKRLSLAGCRGPRHSSEGRGRARTEAAFTLIELLVVMTLIVVLAGVGLAMYSTSVTRAREAVLKENLFQMEDAIDQYHADKEVYPPSLESLVTDGYLRRVPEDPFTESAETWVIVYSEPDPSNPADAPGIFDVKSGSDKRGLDGTPYAEW